MKIFITIQQTFSTITIINKNLQNLYQSLIAVMSFGLESLNICI